MGSWGRVKANSHLLRVVRSSSHLTHKRMISLSLLAAGLLLPNIGERSVTYATSGAMVRAWLDEHVEPQCVLGFDTETRPSYRMGQVHPPAVVQLSTSDACLVAQIFVAETYRVGFGKQKKTVNTPQEVRGGAAEVRDALAEVLESSSVFKAGVSIDDDAIDLWQCWGLEVSSRLELGGSGQRWSLARLLGAATGVELAKPASVQKSDWAAPLGEKQVAYAAADAWAGRAIYERLLELDPGNFSHEALARLLAGERGCSHLYAMRVARQATKAALAAAQTSLAEDGLPHYRGPTAAEGHALAKRAGRRLSDARGLVARSLSSVNLATTLPVVQVLQLEERSSSASSSAASSSAASSSAVSGASAPGTASSHDKPAVSAGSPGEGQ